MRRNRSNNAMYPLPRGDRFPPQYYMRNTNTRRSPVPGIARKGETDRAPLYWERKELKGRGCILCVVANGGPGCSEMRIRRGAARRRGTVAAAAGGGGGGGGGDGEVGENSRKKLRMFR
ncbi:hypothetical protein NL676_034116 [Syzygium grande]|nr:hypothetical protein NL676_034116 [Syzygium grande]